MGYMPSNNYFEEAFFDIYLSKFVFVRPNHPLYFEREIADLFNVFLNISIEDIENVKMSRVQRRELLTQLVSYLGYHHETTYNIESIEILSEIF